MKKDRQENSNVPNLRFEGFEREWGIKELKEFGEIVSGLTYSPNQINDKGILVLRSSNVKNRNLIFEDNVFVLEQNYNPVQEDDILICVRNGSKRLIGKNTIIKKENQGLAFGAFMSVFRSKSNRFLFQWFDTEDYKKEVHKNLGATINSINSNDLKKFKVPFPEISEQEKIANFLSLIDNRIQTQNKIIEDYKLFKKGLMQKLFSQEITFKDKNGMKFPEWKKKKLKDLFTGEKGSGLSKSDLEKDGNYSCILYGELYTTYPEVITKVKSKTNVKNGKISKSGDLLIPCSTTTSNIDLAKATSLNEDDVLIGGDITILRAKQKIYSDFYAFYLTNFKKKELAQFGQGTTIVHLYYNHFKSMLIDVPSFEEQQKIASILSKIDDKITLETNYLEKLKSQKKYLLQNLFI